MVLQMMEEAFTFFTLKVLFHFTAHPRGYLKGLYIQNFLNIWRKTSPFSSVIQHQHMRIYMIHPDIWKVTKAVRQMKWKKRIYLFLRCRGVELDSWVNGNTNVKYKYVKWSTTWLNVLSYRPPLGFCLHPRVQQHQLKMLYFNGPQQNIYIYISYYLRGVSGMGFMR